MEKIISIGELAAALEDRNIEISNEGFNAPFHFTIYNANIVVIGEGEKPALNFEQAETQNAYLSIKVETIKSIIFNSDMGTYLIELANDDCILVSVI